MKELKNFLGIVEGFKNWRNASRNSVDGDPWGKGGPEWGSVEKEKRSKTSNKEVETKTSK